MKAIRLLCISLVGLLLLSACNDNNDSTQSQATQPNEMMEVVNRAIAISPEDASLIDIKNMTVPAPENIEPRML